MAPQQQPQGARRSKKRALGFAAAALLALGAVPTAQGFSLPATPALLQQRAFGGAAPVMEPIRPVAPCAGSRRRGLAALAAAASSSSSDEGGAFSAKRGKRSKRSSGATSKRGSLNSSTGQAAKMAGARGATSIHLPAEQQIELARCVRAWEDAKMAKQEEVSFGHALLLV